MPFARLALPFVLMLAFAGSAQAQTVWSGPTISFSKAAFAGPTLPQNQDAIVPGVVAITRGDNQGLYNAVTEATYTPNASPADTEWAFPQNNPGQTVAAANYAALNFASWQAAHNSNPPATVGEPAVLHIISEDIYLDLSFTSWGEMSAGGGAFSYTRSTPSPAPVPGLGPMSLGLVVLGSTLTAIRARRRSLVS